MMNRDDVVAMDAALRALAKDIETAKQARAVEEACDIFKRGFDRLMAAYISVEKVRQNVSGPPSIHQRLAPGKDQEAGQALQLSGA